MLTRLMTDKIQSREEKSHEKKMLAYILIENEDYYATKIKNPTLMNSFLTPNNLRHFRAYGFDVLICILHHINE